MRTGDGNTGFPKKEKKKKYCSGLVPLRTLSPARPSATLSSGILSTNNTRYQSDWRMITVRSEFRPSSDVVLCKEVESLNAHGAETCVPAERRQSTAMQTAERGGDRRAHLLRDRRRVLLLLVYFFFCVIPKQCRTENYNSRDKQVKCNGPCLVLSLPFKHPNTPPRLHLALKWYITTYHHRLSCNFYLKQNNMQIRHIHTL